LNSRADIIEGVAEPASILTALIRVVPEPGNDVFDGAPGAWTNFYLLADEERFYALVNEDGAFREAVHAAMKTLGLVVHDIEPMLVVDPAEQSSSIQELLRELSEATPWVHDTFHVYESVD
jgi:hypothetical protein